MLYLLNKRTSVRFLILAKLHQSIELDKIINVMCFFKQALAAPYWTEHDAKTDKRAFTTNLNYKDNYLIRLR
jgi:hypothetical protein